MYNFIQMDWSQIIIKPNQELVYLQTKMFMILKYKMEKFKITMLKVMEEVYMQYL